MSKFPYAIVAFNKAHEKLAKAIMNMSAAGLIIPDSAIVEFIEPPMMCWDNRPSLSSCFACWIHFSKGLSERLPPADFWLVSNEFQLNFSNLDHVPPGFRVVGVCAECAERVVWVRYPVAILEQRPTEDELLCLEVMES